MPKYTATYVLVIKREFEAADNRKAIKMAEKDLGTRKANNLLKGLKEDIEISLVELSRGEKEMGIIKRPTWDETFMEIAHVLAKRSKDKSTKVGAVIVGLDNEIRSTGYNCFPRGLDDTNEERQVRPHKYHFFEHAERNAIYNAARAGIALDSCILYVSWVPCSDCARAIIQAGIYTVVVETLDIPDRWLAHCYAALEMFDEAGVEVNVVSKCVDVGTDTLNALKPRLEALNAGTQ